MANGDTSQQQRTRTADKWLPYMRELGAMAILAMVLYGVWDIFKNEGRLAIEAVDKQTNSINNLTTVQTKILDHLKRQEVNANASYSNPGVFGPPYSRNRNE